MAEFVGLDHLSISCASMPITIRLAEPISVDELMAFSQRNRPYRVERNERGELEIMSPVGGDGSRLESIANFELQLWAREHGGVCFSSAGGFTLPDGSVRSPDAAWIPANRWSGLSKAERQSYPPLCPDFLIEILSLSDSRPELEAKMQRWIANGAQLAWMIDPFARLVRIYRPNAEMQTLDDPESVLANVVVPGFRLNTASLWDEPVV